ncbi:low molecular weight protein arginine phosphatase, partial [Chloroflexota bacterium]
PNQIMHSVLIVCTANICRSPMAMGLLLDKLNQKRDQWRVESAGVWAIDGLPAAEKTLFVLSERGIDIRNHRSRLITPEIIQKFNLILVMESNHKEALRLGFPELSSQIFLLTEMKGDSYDLKDPIGGSFSDFEDTAKAIEDIFNLGFENIYKLSLA